MVGRGFLDTYPELERDRWLSAAISEVTHKLTLRRLEVYICVFPLLVPNPINRSEGNTLMSYTWR
jgi:hypothetical protein